MPPKHISQGTAVPTAGRHRQMVGDPVKTMTSKIEVVDTESGLQRAERMRLRKRRPGTELCLGCLGRSKKRPGF